ncbi:MAG: DNA mismatch repair endonuclease MutL, partial [Eubacteriales bacterium]|nr:DNA mismatch repair endonuclease MutL [Eubacteriales bacterium]
MNTEIKVLENNLINKIAAGEVIERPASIVKELVENSIDAGATNITIEIKNGGTSLIKITDNGSGIKKSQIKTAFLRHATSKLQKLSDLDSILTLGFRGEALSSIASISQVEVISKTKEDAIGTKLYISGGNIISEEDTACLEGTSFTVKNIFFNTPARRKFLKKDSVESGYISEIVNRLALGHPSISFKYINNNSTMLQTSGNNDIKNTILNIYGKDVAQKMISFENSKNGFKLYGFIGLPELSRGNRNYENFFINGRYIKSSIVTNAIEEAYSGKIMVHKFPIFVVNLNVPENTVDVNVHPTKLEVRFEDEDFIFEFIKNTIEKTLQSQTLIPEVKTNTEYFSDIAKTKPFNLEKQNNLEELLLAEDESNFNKNLNIPLINEPSLKEEPKNSFNEKLDLIYPKNKDSS